MSARKIYLSAMLLLAACSPSSVDVANDHAAPQRIVSLDYCADQYVLMFADRADIIAVSPEAAAPHSFMRENAVGLPTVRASAEDVLVLEPDLVVRSYGGGAGATSIFEQAGIDVLQVGWSQTLDGDDANTVPQVVQAMADGLGASEKGRAVIADYRERLQVTAEASDNRAEKARSVLYMTPTGVTTGPGSFVDEMVRASGLSNFQTEPGWQPLPLERLAYEQPDRIAAAFFETPNDHKNRWSAARHPVARAQLARADVVNLQGAWTSCGGWFIVNAVEALAAPPESIEKSSRAE